MDATLNFDPSRYTEAALRLILAKAEQWQVPPAEAVARLLDQLATPRKSKHAA